MSSANVTLIVDDRDPNIRYNCPVIKQTVAGSYFRDTWTTIDSLSCGLQLGWFSYRFNGTQVRIWVTDSQVNQNYSVQIDNGHFVGQSGSGYYESPILADGEHTVVYGSSNQSVFPAFDYLTVKAGASTQLFGQSVIVDDQDITTYSGKWFQQPLSEAIFSRPLAIYQNTSTWTNTTGDTFTMQFEGNSVAVMGVMPNTDVAPGNSSVACIVDGVSTTVRLPMGTTQVQPMVEFCRADLAAGTHTLVFNVTALAPTHSFGVDFVVYNSTVNTTLPAASQSGSIIQASSTSSHSITHSRVIIGATIGACALVVALLGILIFTYRRQRLRGTSKWMSSKTAQ